MRPRVHNIVSYGVTLLVFWAVLLGRSRAAGLPAGAGLGAGLWTLHFVRRSLESAFVHRYSKPRIAASDYLTEYLYYWGFAAWIAWAITAPTHRAQALPWQLLGLAMFALAELGNARAHRMLRALRSEAGQEKPIPRGFLFEFVSCPHYFCEISAWFGFNLVTATLAGVAFMLVGAGILAAWAHTRHAAYVRAFDGQGGRELYPSQRRALLPFLF